MSYAGGFVFVRRFLRALRLPAVSLAAAQVLAATFVQAGVSAVLGVGTPRWTVPVVVAVACMGLLSTALAYVLYFRLIDDFGATTASAVNYVVPVVAGAVGVLAWSEEVTWHLVAGGLVVLGSVAYAQRPLPPPREAPTAARVSRADRSGSPPSPR